MLKDLIGQAGYDALVKKDPSYTSIQGIRPDSEIKLEDLKELAQIAKDNPHLTSVLMCSNSITDAGATYLAQLQYVTELQLEGNQIGKNGVAALMKMPRLRKLNLGSNKIGDDAAALLASSQLTHLHLYGNQITDDGAQLFLKNKTLVDLALNGNQLSMEVEETIEAYIENNKAQSARKPLAPLPPSSRALPSDRHLQPAAEEKQKEGAASHMHFSFPR